VTTSSVNLTGLEFVGVWLIHLQIFFGSLEVFINLQKFSEMFGKIWLLTTFEESLEIFRKWSEIFGKAQNCCYVLWECYLTKWKLHGHLILETQNFSSLVEKFITLTFQHSKRNFESSCGHEKSSVFLQLQLWHHNWW